MFFPFPSQVIAQLTYGRAHKPDLQSQLDWSLSWEGGQDNKMSARPAGPHTIQHTRKGPVTGFFQRVRRQDRTDLLHVRQYARVKVNPQAQNTCFLEVTPYGHRYRLPDCKVFCNQTPNSQSRLNCSPEANPLARNTLPPP